MFQKNKEKKLHQYLYGSRIPLDVSGLLIVLRRGMTLKYLSNNLGNSLFNVSFVFKTHAALIKRKN